MLQVAVHIGLRESTELATLGDLLAVVCVDLITLTDERPHKECEHEENEDPAYSAEYHGEPPEVRPRV